MNKLFGHVQILFDRVNNLFIFTPEQSVHCMPSAVNQKPQSRTALRRRINVELARRGWNQQSLAKEIGRARNTVNRAMNHGENETTFELILTALGIRP